MSVPGHTVLGMDLDVVAERLGVRVDYLAPMVGDWGEYDASAHRIALHPALGPVQLFSTYAHELGHAMYRHGATTAHTEREATHAAHWLTIPLCGFLRAIQAHDSAQAVAHELGVMPADVRAYGHRLGGNHADRP